MSALDEWCRLPYPVRQSMIEAIDSAEVRAALAQIFDPPNSANELNGSEMTHIQEHALATALAVLEGT